MPVSRISADADAWPDQPPIGWETAANHIQVRERTGDQQPMGILGLAAVADLREPKDAFDDADDLFHLGPYLGFGAVLRPRPTSMRPRYRLDGSCSPAPAGHAANHGRLPLVRPIAPDPRLATMQEARQDRAVGHVGRRGSGRVDQLCLTIHAKMRLHPEVPLLPFRSLMHLGIPRLVGILRRTRGADNRGIHNGAGGHPIPKGVKMSIHGLEERRPEPMRFQQMPEPTDRGFVGNRFPPQVNADERTHGQRVVQGLLDRRIGEVEPLLQEIDPEHLVDPHGASARPLRLRIHRLDHRAQRLPEHHPSHCCEKHVTLRKRSNPRAVVKVVCVMGVASRWGIGCNLLPHRPGREQNYAEGP